MLSMSEKINWTVTAAINNDICQSEDFKKEIFKAIGNFTNDYWGDLPEEDKRANDELLKTMDGCLLGRYKTSNGDIYIKLDCNTFIGTILYCNEY